MPAQIRILKDAALYINTNTYVGLVAELDLPNVERTTAAHETLAMQGTINVGVGKEAMESRIGWMGKTKAMSKVAYNTQDVQDFQVRGVIEDISGPKKTLENVVWYYRGVFRSYDPGKFSAKSLATSESMVDVHYFREEIDGEVMCEQDFANNIDKVGGVDLNAARNKMLGFI